MRLDLPPKCHSKEAAFMYIMVSLFSGIVESLRNLLKDDDVTVRQKSTECLYVMSCKS